MISNSTPAAGSSRRQFLRTLGAGLAAAGGLRVAATAPASEEAPAWKKAGLKLGLASYSTRKLEFDKTLAIARQVGLEYLCLKSMHLPLDAKPEQIAAAVAKIKDWGLTLYGCGVVDMNKEAQVQQAFDYAKAASMSVIVAMPSPAMLPLIDKMVQKYDIRVAIHNHGPTDKIWPTPDVIIPKIEKLDRRVGLCIDIGHTVRAGADLLSMTEKYADRLFDLHMKDVDGATAKSHTVVVGKGVIDIPGFLRVLKKINYKGVISFEYEDQPDNPLPGLSDSVEYVKKALAKL
jgi:inosose dehydratase